MRRALLPALCVLLAGCAGDEAALARRRDRLINASVPRLDNLASQGPVIALGRRYRQVDETISAVAAGEAIQRLTFDSAQAWSRDAEPLEGIWTREELEQNPLITPDLPDGIPYGAWHRRLLPKVVAGLNPAERAYLDSIANRPAAEVLAVVAAAPSADVIGTRHTFSHLPGDRFVLEIPVNTSARLAHAAAALQARAALAMADGQPRVAERHLRQMINLGVVVYDAGTQSLDVATGLVIASRGLETLASLYQLSGYPSEAEELRAELARASYGSGRGIGLPDTVTVATLFETLPALAARRDLPLGLKLENLSLAQMVRLWDLCDGNPDAHVTPEWRASILRGLGRTPHAAELVDWMLWVPEPSACSSIFSQ